MSGSAAPPPCHLCRYYRYLRTLDEHLCKHPEIGGIIPKEDVSKGCDDFEMDTQEEIDRRMEALKGTPWGEALR